MPNMTLLAVAGGLSLVGAVAGVSLGRSTVAEINPAYMQDAEVPFYSGLVPGGRPRADWAQVQAQEYQAEAQTPPPASCVGCTWPVDPTPREDPAIARYDRLQSARYETPAPVERAEAPVRIVVVEQPAQRDWSNVTRYAEEPVRRAAASMPAEPADDGADGGDAATQ